MFRVVSIALVLSACCFAAVGHAQENSLEAGFRQLTSGYQAGYPDWSPCGEYIVFTSEWSEQAEGDLWIIPAEGGERVQLTQSGGHHGVFSPDGKYVAYDAEAGSVVRVIPSSGGVPIRIVPESIPVEHSGNPCWSPDGTRLAFRSMEDVYVLELATGVFTKVFHEDGCIPLPIQWMPTEESIVVSLINPEDETANLRKIALEGGEALQLTHAGRTTQGTVSPDGRYLVYSTTLDGEDYDLWVVSSGGGEPLQLTSGPELDVEPCWSPHGDQLVIRSWRGGDTIDLWIMDVDLGWIAQELTALNGD